MVTQARGFWAALGIDPLAERLYLRVLASPGETLSGYAKALDSSTTRLRQAGDLLVDKRLVRRSGRSLEPAEPRTALTSLVRSHQTLLDGAGLVADELAGTWAAGRLHADADHLVEMLHVDEIGDRLADLIEGAVRSIDATAAPPYSPSTNAKVEAAEARALERRVPFRAVYDTAVLNDADQLPAVLAAVGRGEQARTWPDLQQKMIIVDGAQVLMPLAHLPLDGRVHAVVVSRSSLSEALVTLFTLLWDAATPITLDKASGEVPHGPRRSDTQLLRLCASGMSDQAIARHLAISERTLRRRLATLQRQLAVSNRFQLALTASRRGLLD